MATFVRNFVRLVIAIGLKLKIRTESIIQYMSIVRKIHVLKSKRLNLFVMLGFYGWFQPQGHKNAILGILVDSLPLLSANAFARK